MFIQRTKRGQRLEGFWAAYLPIHPNLLDQLAESLKDRCRMKSNESGGFRWSGEALQKAIQESVKSACKTFGLEFDSFSSSGTPRIGESEYVPGPPMFKWTFSGSAGKPFFIEIAFRTAGQDDWVTTVTTSDGFSQAYTLPGDDETAFGPVRNCVSDRLEEFKTNG